MVCDRDCDLDVDINRFDPRMGAIQGRIALESVLIILLAHQCVLALDHVHCDFCEQLPEIDNLIILNPLTSG